MPRTVKRPGSFPPHRAWRCTTDTHEGYIRFEMRHIGIAAKDVQISRMTVTPGGLVTPFVIKPSCPTDKAEWLRRNLHATCETGYAKWQSQFQRWQEQERKNIARAKRELATRAITFEGK